MTRSMAMLTCSARSRKGALVLFLCSLLAACGEPRLSALADDAIILAFGDSLTFGTGASPAEAYPAVLAALTGRTVINAGVPGEVTQEGLERLPGLLREHRPDLVVLIHGGNDTLRNRPVAETRANLRAMIERCRESGAELVMLGVPGRNLILAAPSYYGEIADALQVPIDATTLPELMRNRSMKSDAVHLNGEGYARMAAAVVALLRDEGATPRDGNR